jgi:hypothetical protein
MKKIGFGIFGGMKRAKTQIDGMNPKAWMDYTFDHTFIVAEDDPFLESFKKMDGAGVAQVRVLRLREQKNLPNMCLKN